MMDLSAKGKKNLDKIPKFPISAFNLSPSNFVIPKIRGPRIPKSLPNSLSFSPYKLSLLSLSGEAAPINRKKKRKESSLSLALAAMARARPSDRRPPHLTTTANHARDPIPPGRSHLLLPLPVTWIHPRARPRPPDLTPSFRAPSPTSPARAASSRSRPPLQIWPARRPFPPPPTIRPDPASSPPLSPRARPPLQIWPPPSAPLLHLQIQPPTPLLRLNTARPTSPFLPEPPARPHGRRISSARLLQYPQSRPLAAPILLPRLLPHARVTSIPSSPPTSPPFPTISCARATPRLLRLAVFDLPSPAYPVRDPYLISFASNTILIGSKYKYISNLFRSVSGYEYDTIRIRIRVRIRIRIRSGSVFEPDPYRYDPIH